MQPTGTPRGNSSVRSSVTVSHLVICDHESSSRSGSSVCSEKWLRSLASYKEKKTRLRQCCSPSNLLKKWKNKLNDSGVSRDRGDLGERFNIEGLTRNTRGRFSIRRLFFDICLRYYRRSAAGWRMHDSSKGKQRELKRAHEFDRSFISIDECSH